jgi:negative regulator of flagellin synthesis FlgM
MKIGSTFDTRSTAGTGGGRVESQRPERAGSGPAQGAEVRLSDLSTRLADLEAKIAGTDAFDAKRVEEIKQAIAEGRFKMNPDVVADKLIEHVREMLSGKTA